MDVLTDINIMMSWGAVSVLATLIIAMMGTWGVLFWKFNEHTNNSDVHINKHVHLVTRETCNITKENISQSLKEVKETNKDLANKLDETNKLLVQFLAHNQKEM